MRSALLGMLAIAVAACGDDSAASGGSGGSGGTGASTTTTTGGMGGAVHPGGGGAGAGDEGGSNIGGTGEGGAGGSMAGCVRPEGGLWATFDVVGQIYHAQITNDAGIQQALDLWAGKSAASIPNGELVCSPATYNCGYGFHQDPATIQFAELTTEVCDGTPEYVDENCASFGMYFCPWAAQLIELYDCRTDPNCPPVPVP